MLIEVNGRPVLALQGDAPMYRTLRPGDTGDDVRQLELALARLGFDPGPVDGTYDAVDRARRHRDLRVERLPRAGADRRRSRRRWPPREGAVRDADDRVAEAEAALAEAGEATSRADLLGMQNEVAQSERALDAARADADRNAAPRRPPTVADRAGGGGGAPAPPTRMRSTRWPRRGAAGLDPDATDAPHRRSRGAHRRPRARRPASLASRPRSRHVPPRSRRPRRRMPRRSRTPTRSPSSPMVRVGVGRAQRSSWPGCD